MKNNLFKGIIVILAFASIVSCSEELEQSETGYLPFKSSQNGKWGMIGTDGTILFEEEFKDEPTSAKNGRFLVRNGNGLWEIYTAESKPERIGEEYLQIADFTSSVTPSVKKNERICLIDVDGNVKATLDKANNKSIVKCSLFLYGYAMIMTEDNMFGIINTKGEVVIEPKYAFAAPISGSRFYVVLKNNNEEANTIKILDTSGDDILEMTVGDGHKYTEINPELSTSKYLAVSTSVDGESQWGFIDYSKNVVVKPSSKIKSISEVKGDKFIFSDGKNYGVMNFDGEVVLRPKYDHLYWADDDMLIAYDPDLKNYVINLDGDKITKEKYLNILPFYDKKHAAVKVDDNSWGFIDKNGEELKIKNAPDIYYITSNSACYIVESDFVDIDAIVSRLKLDKNGIMGFRLDMTPQQIVKAYNEVEGNTKGSINATPEDNRGRDRVNTTYSSRGLDIDSEVYYQSYLTEDEGDGIVWSKEHPSYISAVIGGEMLNGKLDLLFSKVAANVKSYGKIMRENSRAIVVKMSEDRGWVVINNNTKLSLKVFNNRDFQSYDINSYAKDNETTRDYIKPSEEKYESDDMPIANEESTYETNGTNNTETTYGSPIIYVGNIGQYSVVFKYENNHTSSGESYFCYRYTSVNTNNGSYISLKYAGEKDGYAIWKEYIQGENTGTFYINRTNTDITGTFVNSNGQTFNVRATI